MPMIGPRMGTITKETENVQVFYQILVYNINKKHFFPAILYIQFHSPLGVLILGYLAQILIICGSVGLLYYCFQAYLSSGT